MKRADTENLSNIVTLRRPTLTGHILRLPPDRRQSGYAVGGGVPDRGQRRRGLHENMQEMRVSWSGVRRMSSVRSRWKRLVAQHCSRSGKIVYFLQHSLRFLSYVECTRYGLLRSMILGVCQSVTRLRCANVAEWSMLGAESYHILTVWTILFNGMTTVKRPSCSIDIGRANISSERCAGVIIPTV